jgi:hypothetical protein
MIIGRIEFRQLARLLGYPAVAGPVEIQAGEAAWDMFVERSTPPDRAAVVADVAPWFTPELVATDAARERLRRWAVTLKRPTISRRALCRDLVVVGLDPVRPMIISAIRRMPPPVAHYLVHHSWILGAHRHVSGWTWQAPPAPRGALQLIVLNAGVLDSAELRAVVAHEIGHAWLTPTVPLDRVQSIHERETAQRRSERLARAWGLGSTLEREVARNEGQAAELARSWGFEGRAADAEACASLAIAAMRRRPL